MHPTDAELTERLKVAAEAFNRAVMDAGASGLCAAFTIQTKRMVFPLRGTDRSWDVPQLHLGHVGRNLL